MKRVIAVLLALALIAGAELVQARSGGGGGRGGGGGHAGGGGHSGGGGHAGGGGHPGMGGGGHTGGPMHFTGGPTRFTTGPMHFTGQHPGHPIGVRPRPPAVVVGKPFFPHRGVIVSGAVVVGAPWFWWPPYPYPYPYYPPAYGGPAYTEMPTYVEQGQGAVYYWCPDYQDYYPNVQSCPSPWVPVGPGVGGTPNY